MKVHNPLTVGDRVKIAVGLPFAIAGAVVIGAAMRLEALLDTITERLSR